MEERVLLQQWLTGIKVAQISHLRATDHYNRTGRLLGLLVTIASTLVSTSIFSNLSTNSNTLILIATGVISMFSAIVSGLQTFLNYPELATKHRQASLRYSHLRRHVEEILISTPNSTDLQAVFKEVRTLWCQIEDESPDIPKQFHRVALKMVKPDLANQRGE